MSLCSTLDLEIDFKIDLIKIDVEGSELSVLKGGELLIKKYNPFIFLEIQDQKLLRPIVDYGNSINYDLYYIYRKNIYKYQSKEISTKKISRNFFLISNN